MAVQSLLFYNSFIFYWRRIGNQQIECWWGFKETNHTVLDEHVQTLQDNGYFSRDLWDKSLNQFCFLDLVQVTLSLCHTNTHTKTVNINIKTNTEKKLLETEVCEHNGSNCILMYKHPDYESWYGFYGEFGPCSSTSTSFFLFLNRPQLILQFLLVLQATFSTVRQATQFLVVDPCPGISIRESKRRSETQTI